jgi:hypothetical protein
MLSTFTFPFTIVPPTSQLEASAQVQRPSDFVFTSTTVSIDTSCALDSNYRDVDWSRLLGYERVPRLSVGKK